MWRELETGREVPRQLPTLPSTLSS